MITFEISMNGKRLYTMGAEEFGNMHFTTQWMRLKCEDGTIYEHAGSVGLAAGNDKKIGTWPAISSLKVGDEITVCIIEVDTFDPPEHLQPSSSFDQTSTTTNIHRVRYDAS